MAIEQDDLEITQETLEAIAAHTRTHEPHAVNTISNIEQVLQENSFDADDYQTI